jgi:magnesium transporter
MLEAQKETLEELRQTNDSLLSAKTNNVMKTLTIITFATYPSILLAGIFGMNTKNAPIVGQPHDFLIIILLIILITSFTFGFFVYKRWF